MRVNERIRAREVRLIDTDGEQVGIIPVEEAIGHAEEAGLDLVEVAPQAKPPVCRIMDYGKYKYKQQQKAKASRAAQHQVKIKELRLRPTTDDHDVEVKLRSARRFLKKNNKVRFSMRFRGREMAHKELGEELMERIAEDLDDLADIESPPKMDGRKMIMMLGPAHTKKKGQSSKSGKAKAQQA